MFGDAIRKKHASAYFTVSLVYVLYDKSQSFATSLQNCHRIVIFCLVVYYYFFAVFQGLKVMEYKDLSKAQQSGIVTLELDYAGALLVSIYSMYVHTLYWSYLNKILVLIKSI